MHRRSLPISLRLALFYGLTLLLLLSGFAVFSYTGFHLALHRDFDSHLTHEERELIPFVTTGADGPRFEGLDRLTSVAYETEGIYGTYVRLMTPAGEVRYQSPNFAGHEPLPVVPPETGVETSLSRTWDGLPARTRYVPLFAGDRPPGDTLAGWLEVTGFEWSLHRGLDQLGRTLAIGVLVSTLFAFAGGWWLARRTLRPVAKMTEAARRMSTAGGRSTLAARLPTHSGPPDELTELAETFNGWLAQLEASVARERRFTANAAHELLTPLAALRNEAEVALRREREAPAYRETITNNLLDAERMTATVQGLLRLAHAETLVKQAEGWRDLSALAAERVARIRPRAEAKGLSLVVEAEPDVLVTAEAAPLAEVVDNLLQNAVKYTPPGGRVAVAVERMPPNGQADRQAGREAVLRVSDTGAGFSPAEGSHLFDRFYRSDAPAVQAESGSGLGLAIVQTIAEAYGGRVAARSAGPEQGATFEVWLPSVPEES